MRATSLLQPPAPRPGGVVRQELLDRLAEGLAGKLVVVVGPAGWGKTSLLRDWWQAAEEAGRSWLSVEAAHNDPVQFWSDFVQAIGTAWPGTGPDLETLAASTTPGYVEPLLINHLARLPGHVTLVLDDFHLITNLQVLAGFEFLVEHLPPTLSLVVAARSDPALPLARLRGRGELAEIRTAQLAFSEAEAAELLAGTLGLALSAEQVHALWQRTEGWPAGLYLAGLALRARNDDPARFIAAFAGDERHIADYLAAEVLAGLTPRIRCFLLRTCVLERLSAPLCDAVTGAAGSQALLEEIDRAQLFVMPLDDTRHWYRYHALFAEMLHSELDRSEPGLAALLHRRAAAWYRQHGPVTKAIDHALAAGDLVDARELIAAHWGDVLNEGLARTMQSWLDQLPLQMITEDARMCLLRAILALNWGPVDEALAWLETAEAAVPMGPLRQGPASVESAVSTLRAAYHHLTGDLAGAETAIRPALRTTATGNGPWLDQSVALLGIILFWRGQHAEADMLFKRIIHPSHQSGSNFASLLALGYTAAIEVQRGDRAMGERHLRRAGDVAARHRLRGHWVTLITDLVTTQLLVDRGELPAAKAVAHQALDNARRGQARLETAAALLLLARIDAHTGHTADASALMGEARDILGTLPDPGVLTSILAETEHMAGSRVPIPLPSGHTRPDGLTDREAEVLGLVAQGYTNFEIAASLTISVHTVERHLQNSYRKIGVRNRADAATYMAHNDD